MKVSSIVEAFFDGDKPNGQYLAKGNSYVHYNLGP